MHLTVMTSANANAAERYVSSDVAARGHVPDIRVKITCGTYKWNDFTYCLVRLDPLTWVITIQCDGQWLDTC